MKHTHLIPSLLLALTLISCTHRQQPVRDRSDLTGAWVLRHVEYPSGTEEDYSMQGDGTSCLIYDHENRLYACNISTTPTGLLVKPTAATTVTLVDKGGGGLGDVVGLQHHVVLEVGAEGDGDVLGGG